MTNDLMTTFLELCDPFRKAISRVPLDDSWHYIPNHLYQMYRPYVNGPLPVTESVWRRLTTLPLFPDLTDDQQDMVINAIQNYRNE